MFNSVLKRIRFWFTRERIGGDTLISFSTHMPWLFRKLYADRFFKFSRTANVRPGANLVNISRISIGENVVIRSGCYIYASEQNVHTVEIIIEDDVLLGSGVHIYTNNHMFEDVSVPIRNQGFDFPRKVILNKGCWVGAQVTILPGVNIGKNAVIGAGSVVTKSVPDYCLAVGNPARVVRSLVK